MFYSCAKYISFEVSLPLCKYIHHLSIRTHRKKSSKKLFKLQSKRSSDFWQQHKRQDNILHGKSKAIPIKQTIGNHSITSNINTRSETWRTTINTILMIGSMIVPPLGNSFVLMNIDTSSYFLGIWNLNHCNNIISSEIYLCTFVVEAISACLNLGMERDSKVRKWSNIIPAIISGCNAVCFAVLDCSVSLPLVSLHVAIMGWHLYEIYVK